MDTVESQVAGIRSELNSLDKRLLRVEKWVDVDSPNFHKMVEADINTRKGVEKEAERTAAIRHQENIERMKGIDSRNTLWSLVIAFFGLICAMCMLYLTFKAATHAELDPSIYFHTEISAPEYAESGTVNAKGW